VNDNIKINKDILTFLDELSKSTVLTSLKQHDAAIDHKAFALNIVLKFGAPAEILLD
jgi:hypothetical protein